MQVHHCTSAGRRYTVATQLDSHTSPTAAAKQVRDEASVAGAEAIVVIAPPSSEKDGALGLFSFTPELAPRPANGVDALCGYEALREHADRPIEAVELRFEGHAVTVVGMHNDAHRMEIDLGKPGLDAHTAGLRTSDVQPIEGAHTFEIQLDDAGDTTIVTLVQLVGLHAVAFTDDFDLIDLPKLGEALQSLGSRREPICAHAAKLGAPGELEVRSWDPVTGVGPANGFGLGAICAAGVTMCCTTAENTVRYSEGELSAGWDGDGHVRLRGTVDTTQPAAAT